MARSGGSHKLLRMTQFDRDGDAPEQDMITPSAVVWNTVVPALGLALILGAPLLPAISIAGVASITVSAVLAPESRRRQWRRWISSHLAPHRVPRGSS
jgi:uncharacterized membrane protein